MSDVPAEQAQAPAPATRGKLLVTILLSALIAAIAAGGVVYLLAGSRGSAASADNEEASQDKGPKKPAIYVKFDPPFVVNFEAKGMMRFLQVSLEVMTRDPATAELVKVHDPKLRNELLLLLGNQTYETISTREGKERLRHEALQEVAKVIGAEGGDGKKVEDLFFTSFVMQ